MKKVINFIKPLYMQVLLAVLFGILVGYTTPEWGIAAKPLGDGFIKLIKMLLAPIIFCTVVSGIAGMENMKNIGKTAGYALLYFEVVSTLALVVGMVAVHVVAPGEGMNIDPETLKTSGASMYAGYAAPAKMQGFWDFILHIIPHSLVGAFAQGETLQVLFIAVFFGFSLHALGEKGRLIFEIIDKISHVLFHSLGVFMKLAPIGAFGAMAATIAQYGVVSLLPLVKFIATLYGACFLFVVLVLGGLAWAYGFSLWKFIRYIREELLIVLGTCSSETVFPRMLAKLENMGIHKSVVGMVLPAGYSFNLDGTSIYLSMGAIFIAQATNTPLSWTQELILLAVLMVTSKGAAGVVGSAFVVLAATLSAMGDIPVEGLALIFGIDRFMAQARAITNLIGNGVATVVVGYWCHQVDPVQLRHRLECNQDPVHSYTPEQEMVEKEEGGPLQPCAIKRNPAPQDSTPIM